MTDHPHIHDIAQTQTHDPDLAASAARRVAARTQWQKALARAKERFAPPNVTSEMIDRTADAIGGAADKTAALAWPHRIKIALVAVLGGLFLARKPIGKAAGPLAARASKALQNAANAVKNRLKS